MGSTTKQNPYGGQLYRTAFSVGSKGFLDRKTLLRRASKLTGKAMRLVNHAVNVMSCPKHKTNRSVEHPKGRSKLLRRPDGRIKLIALR